DGDHQKYRDRLTGLGIETTDLPEVLWNFEKFLIGKDGTVVNRFPPNVTVEDPIVVEAIEAALNA
ncbi:MAG: glutathione peroxidase, partial [Actinomycetota bacterium]|nr:glutathione peroxidase [Actinomycetota bacterium]